MKQFLNRLIELLKKPNYILIAAWVIPAAVLLTILYLNFLPFGYQKTLTINVGAKNDDKGEFRLEMSPALGARQELDGQTFRYLDGLAYAVYEPKVVLRNATIEAELTASSGVSFILPPDLTDVKWDYDWNAQNIEQYFQAELSEKQIFEKFQNTESEPIKNVIINSNLKGIDCSAVGKRNGLCAQLPYEENDEPLMVGNYESKRFYQGFSLELTWLAKKSVPLLTGDISLTQNQKEMVLKYKDQTLKYQLPDYFLGEKRTAIVAFDGQNLYLTTDKNENAKAVSMVIAKEEKSQIDGEANSSIASKEWLGMTLPPLRVSRTSAVQSFLFHPVKPSLIDTKDDSIVLDGSTRLVMPNTADKFEDGPFTVYAEWTPEKAENGQQIIGHYNWEIWQNENAVYFRVGRMSSSTGPAYSISYNVNEAFFNKPHTLLAVYSPVSTATSSACHSREGGNPVVIEESICQQPTTNGYIELFVDGVFAGREYFANETIYKDYGDNKVDLTIGLSKHGGANYLQGKINIIKIIPTVSASKNSDKKILLTENKSTTLSLYGMGELCKIKIKVKK